MPALGSNLIPEAAAKSAVTSRAFSAKDFILNFLVNSDIFRPSEFSFLAQNSTQKKVKSKNYGPFMPGAELTEGFALKPISVAEHACAKEPARSMAVSFSSL